MNLDYHEHVTQHFHKLGKDHEATLEFLQQLKFQTDYSEYQPILGYLRYWREEH